MGPPLFYGGKLAQAANAEVASSASMGPPLFYGGKTPLSYHEIPLPCKSFFEQLFSLASRVAVP